MQDIPRALVADDSTTVRNLVARILRKAGFDVIEAADGIEALTALLTQSPDVAVVDHEMPGITGIDLVGRVSQLPGVADIPIVVMTGTAARDAAGSALMHGAADFVRKPCDPTELVARVRKAAESRMRMAELGRQSGTDVLTGLPNRRGMEPILEALQRPRGAGMGLFVIDVDHFKRVNDQWGHEVGDVVLRTVAGRLAATAAPYTVARWGGEEFVAAGRCEGPVDLRRTADRMRRAVCAVPCEHEQDGRLVSIPVTVSIGAVLAPDSQDLRTAMADADAAVYEAKAWGRNQVVVAVDGRLEPAGSSDRRSGPSTDRVVDVVDPVLHDVESVASLERFLRD